MDKTKNTVWKIAKITKSLRSLLITKNKNYGDSALKPIGVFNKDTATNGILMRLDDKLGRIKNSKELRKNDVADLMGYLVLLCADKEWLSFNDLID